MLTRKPITPATRCEASAFSREVRTDDVDCLASSISGWSQRYEQLKPGFFTGSLAEICHGATQLFIERTSHVLRQVCVVPSGHVWFGLPCSAAGGPSINGEPIQAGNVVLHKGGQQFELLTPDNLDFWGVVVREDDLMRRAREMDCESWLEDRLGCSIMRTGPADIQVALQTCTALLRTRPEIRASQHPALDLSLSESTLDMLFALFASTMPPERERKAIRLRHGLVERADEYVRAHSDRLVTISELCGELGVSRRALQNCFQEILGLNPHAYIRAVSLNAVRSQLRNLQSPYTSIQDAAAAFGFWHMSQFAQDYRQLFGERPSDTLRRRQHS